MIEQDKDIIRSIYQIIVDRHYSECQGDEEWVNHYDSIFREVESRLEKFIEKMDGKSAVEYL